MQSSQDNSAIAVQPWTVGVDECFLQPVRYRINLSQREAKRILRMHFT